MKNFIAIIPARYGSTRFPGKPLAKINGKPMIQHVVEGASKFFEHVVVATDDSRIESTVHNFGGHPVMTSEDHRSGTDRCAEALEKAQKMFNTQFDVVVNIQGDEPFIAKEHLQLISSCFESAETQIATLVKKIEKGTELFDVNKPKVVLQNNGNAIYFSRTPIPYFRGENESSWLSKHTYYKHIGLYAYRSDVLQKITRLAPGELEKAESLEQLRWLENGYSITTKVTTVESKSVDTPTDLRGL